MILSALFTLASALSASPALLACGDDQVRRYELAAEGPRETWRWDASEAENLPQGFRAGLLEKIDECKPVADGRVLITASTGGVVLLDGASGDVLFRAEAPMAHSAAVLPGDRIAVALSIHDRGDRLNVYDLTDGEKPVLSLPLPSGHGAVWDAERQRLFALSHDTIQAFALVDWEGDEPRLQETARWTLPGARDGHDLSRAADGSDYLVTTHDGAWRFDPEANAFKALEQLNPALQVKSVDVDAEGRLAWVKAEERWWAFGFSVMQDGRVVRVPINDMHLYKVRWIPAPPRP